MYSFFFGLFEESLKIQLRLGAVLLLQSVCPVSLPM